MTGDKDKTCIHIILVFNILFSVLTLIIVNFTKHYVYGKARH